MYPYKLILAFIISTFIVGCSHITHNDIYTEFDSTQVNNEHGIVLAKFHITYNKKSYNEFCKVCFNSSIGPCYRLDDKGFVFADLPLGQGEIKRLECMDGSKQSYDFSNILFNIKRGSNYIGDINIQWENTGGHKLSHKTSFLPYGVSLVAKFFENISNDGVISVKIYKPQKPEVVSSFQHHIGKSHRIYRNLASIAQK